MRKNPFSNISIKWKIFGYLLCFCGLLLVVLWLFQVVFLEQFYRQIKIQSVYNTARTIQANLDEENLSDTLSALAKNGSLYVEVLDGDCKLISSGDGVKESVLSRFSTIDKQALLDITRHYGGEMLRYISDNGRALKLEYETHSGKLSDTIVLTPNTPDSVRGEALPRQPDNFPPENDPLFGLIREQRFNRMKERSIILSKLVTMADGTERLVVVNAVVTPVNATVEALQVQLWWITGIMLLFSVILAFVISRNVSAPMEAISKKAQILAGGDYGVEFHQAGYREIRQLSDTLTQMSKDLSRVEALRRELIANISHDLRTPLTLIEGYAEAMRDLPGENTPENAQIILDETKRLATLVADTLDLSKLQAGALELSCEPIDLCDMIQNVAYPLSELLKSSGYKVNLHIPNEPVVVQGDGTRLSQAFYNLLINAVNYTGDDKTVVVTLQCADNHATITVADSGDGIAPEDLPYIWDRYYKSAKTGKTHRRGVTGTGLGLSIVKSIFDRHGFVYGVESVSGEGSRFWFTMPISPPDIS